MARRTFWILLSALMLIALIVTLSPTLGQRPLDSHEAFVAQSVREIDDPGASWLVPPFNAEPRLKKPPLQNWCVAIVSHTIPAAQSVPPWAARLPSVIAGLAFIALTVALGAVVYDRRTGLVAGLLVLTCGGFFTVVNSARPEMLYGACCSLLILGLSGARRATDSSRTQRLWALAAWTGFALACLAKGPHLPLIIVGGFIVGLLAEGERGRVRLIVRPLIGLALVALIPGAWVLGVLLSHDGVASVWYEQMFLYAREDEPGGINLLQHLSPYYLHAVPSMTLPWVLPLLFGLFVTFEKDRPDLRRGRVLFWTFIVGVVVMSLHVQRREYYLIPILAPLGVLMARGTIDAIEKIAASAASRPSGASGRAHLLRAIVGVHALAACITVIAVILFHDPTRRITPLILAIAGAGIIGAALISRLPARPGVLIPAAAAFWLAIPATADSHLWWRDRRFSLWSLAQHVASVARPTDPVYSVGGLEALFVYALDRPITQVRSLDEIPTPAPGAVTWIIAEPDELADDNPNLRLRKIEQMDDEGPIDEEDLVLLAAVASTPATDAPKPAPGFPPTR